MWLTFRKFFDSFLQVWTDQRFIIRLGATSELKKNLKKKFTNIFNIPSQTCHSEPSSQTTFYVNLTSK